MKQILKKSLSSLVAGALLVSVSSCMDGETTKLQYMPDMADAPTVKSYREYLDPPEGSIAIDAVFYPESAEQAELILENPLLKSREIAVEQGVSADNSISTFLSIKKPSCSISR